MEKRKSKLILAFVLALILTMSSGIAAFASSPGGPPQGTSEGQITVTYGASFTDDAHPSMTYTKDDIGKPLWMPEGDTLQHYIRSPKYERLIGWRFPYLDTGDSVYQTLTQELYDAILQHQSQRPIGDIGEYAEDVKETESETVSLTLKVVDRNGNPLVEEGNRFRVYIDGHEKMETMLLFDMTDTAEKTMSCQVLVPLDGSLGESEIYLIELVDENGDYIKTLLDRREAVGIALTSAGAEAESRNYDLNVPASITVGKGQPGTAVVTVKDPDSTAGVAPVTQPADPGSANRGSSTQRTSVKDKVPKTGEADHLAFLLAVAACGAAGMILSGKRGKKTA